MCKVRNIDSQSVRSMMPGNVQRSPLGQRTIRDQCQGACDRSSNKDPGQSIDLKELVDQLQERGNSVADLLRSRTPPPCVGEIHDAFRTAIREYDYPRGSLLLRLPDQGESNSGNVVGRSSILASPTIRLRCRLEARLWPCSP